MPEVIQAHLCVVSADGTRAHFPLDSAAVIIGRASDATVRIQDGLISRHHAQLNRDPQGRWVVRDLGSANGTLVNGQPIQEQVIDAADVIQIGHAKIWLSTGESPAPPGSSTLCLDNEELSQAQISSLAKAESPRLSSEHLSLLSELSQHLQATEDEAARRLLLCQNMVLPAFRAWSAVLLRIQSDRPDLPPALLCGPAWPHFQGTEPYVSRTLLREMAKRNEPLLARNVSHGSARGAQPGAVVALSIAAEVNRLAALACPIQTDGASIDVLYLNAPPECGTIEWLALTALAAQHYQQAQTLWVVRRQQQEYAAIERELMRAREIQHRLVPRNVAVPGLRYALGFEPCKWVGGDYVDVVPAGPHRVLLIIADVCGKGMPAALTASALHTVVHTAAGLGVTLEQLMTRLNAYLCSTLQPGTFVTALAMELDLATGNLLLVNAGHPPGIIIGPDENIVSLPDPPNPPLGLEPGTLISQSASLPHGHVLALFTDGLTELTTPTGELLGNSRLEELLSAALAASPGADVTLMAERLSTALDQAQGPSPAQDDRTFILARRAEPHES